MTGEIQERQRQFTLIVVMFVLLVIVGTIYQEQQLITTYNQGYYPHSYGGSYYGYGWGNNNPSIYNMYGYPQYSAYQHYQSYPQYPAYSQHQQYLYYQQYQPYHVYPQTSQFHPYAGSTGYPRRGYNYW